MASWKWIPLFGIVIIGGIGMGWWVRTAGATRHGPDVTERAPHRGQGNVLIEYFDPACAGSRVLHQRLDEEFAQTRFQHVMVPVAIGRGVDSVPADALCALSGDQVWRQASAWSQKPPKHVESLGLDLTALQACAGIVEAATQHIASISGTGEIVTPVVEFDGHVYVGSKSTDDLLSALRSSATP